MKKCLKFEGYIYLPKKEAIGNKADYKYRVRYPAPGRIELFDENNKRTGDKMKAFGTLGEMQVFIEKEIRRRITLIFKEEQKNG